MRRLAWLLALLLLPAAQAQEPDDILGIWATERAEAHVEIFKRDDRYHGRITWLKEPFYPEGDAEAGQPRRDRENEDPELREREIIGLEIVNGFRYVGKGRWTDGTIYDPENGKTYNCKMWLTRDGRLRLRGYVGVSLFGRTTEWIRVLR
ncbi:MAG TPA: DUF2147 domain-containing protein [Gammaproteobacteria bacterium]|nr:DUF2147 domain-containing protein [Gammaproteobacteria bacterium]